MASQENHVAVVKYLLDRNANPALATEVLAPSDCYFQSTLKTRVAVVWLSDSALVSINEVTLCWAQLVVGSVTGLGFNSQCGKVYLSM